MGDLLIAMVDQTLARHGLILWVVMWVHWVAGGRVRGGARRRGWLVIRRVEHEAHVALHLVSDCWFRFPRRLRGGRRRAATASALLAGRGHLARGGHALLLWRQQ
jgi:hypothetical protein